MIGYIQNSSDNTVGSCPGAAELPRLTTRGDRQVESNHVPTLKWLAVDLLVMQFLLLVSLCSNCSQTWWCADSIFCRSILGLGLGVRWSSAKHDIDGHTSVAPKHEMKWCVTCGWMDTGVAHHAHLQCLCRISSRMCCLSKRVLPTTPIVVWLRRSIAVQLLASLYIADNPCSTQTQTELEHSSRNQTDYKQHVHWLQLRMRTTDMAS